MKILFYHDGTLQADQAVRFGAPIVAACQAEAAILGVAVKPEKEKALLKALRRAQDILQASQLKAELVTKVGKPSREIFNYIKETHYDLLVIGGVRENPLWHMLAPLWQSVRAYKIVEALDLHVLVVLGHRPELRHILLCTDGSPALDPAVAFVAKIAPAVQAKVDLFHVLPKMPAIYTQMVRLDEDLDRLLESDSDLGRTLRHQIELLQESGVFGKMRLRHGLEGEELQKELHGADYDLVVTGSSPAKERLRKYIMGDITRAVVNHSEIPVLIFRTGVRTVLGLVKDFLIRPFRRFRKNSGEPHQ